MDREDFALSIVAMTSIGTSAITSIENGWSASAGQSTTEGGNNGDVGMSIIMSPVYTSGTTYGLASVDDSFEPDIIVKTKDSNNYEKVEARAQRIYDKFNKNHNTDYKPAVLIASTPEQAKALTEIFDMFDSEEDLYIFLTALQTVLEEMVEEEQKEKVKTKKLEK